jgi:hypothetical protein
MRKRPLIDWLKSKLKKEEEKLLDPEDKTVPVVKVEKPKQTWLEWIYDIIDNFLKGKIFSK